VLYSFARHRFWVTSMSCLRVRLVYVGSCLADRWRPAARNCASVRSASAASVNPPWRKEAKERSSRNLAARKISLTVARR